MTNAVRQRREPVQQRSRATVTRILDAAAALIDEAGVDAATTRAIADRAGVAYPSLYRFFADREEILDRLLERHLADLDNAAIATESTWPITTVEDLVNRQLDLHVTYYETHPGALELWFGGRHSPTVLNQVRQRNHILADRVRQTLITADRIPADTDPRIFHVLIELGDRILDLAFRDGPTANPAVINLGRTALNAYLQEALA